MLRAGLDVRLYAMEVKPSESPPQRQRKALSHVSRSHMRNKRVVAEIGTAESAAHDSADVDHAHEFARCSQNYETPLVAGLPQALDVGAIRLRCARRWRPLLKEGAAASPMLDAVAIDGRDTCASDRTHRVPVVPLEKPPHVAQRAPGAETNARGLWMICPRPSRVHGQQNAHVVLARVGDELEVPGSRVDHDLVADRLHRNVKPCGFVPDVTAVWRMLR